MHRHFFLDSRRFRGNVAQAEHFISGIEGGIPLDQSRLPGHGIPCYPAGVRRIKGETRAQLLEKCRQASIVLDEVLETLIPWGVESERLDERLLAALDKIKDQVNKFPSNWIPMIMAQIGSGSGLRDGARIEAYRSGPGRGLSADAARFLGAVQDEPAFFTAFAVEVDHGDDLFEVRDFSSDKVHLLYSPALGETAKNGLKASSRSSFPTASAFRPSARCTTTAGSSRLTSIITPACCSPTSTRPRGSPPS